jgi:dTMP kinase
MRGAFIVVEGLDRAGKSTQVAKLANELNCKAIKFPDRTTAIGTMIDSYLAQKSEVDDRAIHLLFSANRWEASQSILKKLEQGENVVCDRYAFSGIAYSNAKVSSCRYRRRSSIDVDRKGLDYEWCRSPDIGLPRPDLTIFLHLTPEEAAKRGGYGDERYENISMQRRVRESFTRIAQEMDGSGWMNIDAGRDVEEVAEDCKRAALQAVDEIKEHKSPVGKLFNNEK